jgi:GNAT superfamily N-acetyltransferase
VNPKVQIRALRFNDRDQWYELWREYLRFYRQRLPEEITEASFRRLAGDDQQLHGLVAEFEGRLAGFVNYLFHPSSWSLTQVCYLEDLFVDPTMRGGGVGRALIKAVYDAADAAGATTVYWMTQEFNAAGRALYDTLAHRTSFIRYER